MFSNNLHAKRLTSHQYLSFALLQNFVKYCICYCEFQLLSNYWNLNLFFHKTDFFLNQHVVFKNTNYQSQKLNDW